MHTGSVSPVVRAALKRAFEAGAFLDLDAVTFAWQLRAVSAHSTRVGVNQGYFAADEDLAGSMDALRWKSLRMPLNMESRRFTGCLSEEASLKSIRPNIRFGY